MYTQDRIHKLNKIQEDRTLLKHKSNKDHKNLKAFIQKE